MTYRIIVTRLFGLTVLSLCASAHATIDFEGFGPSNAPLTEGTQLSVVTEQGVSVLFETVDTAGNVFTPFIAQAGGQRVAFQSMLLEDTPLNADGTVYAAGGNYSLTDGLRQTHDYHISFSQAVENISIDLYDFRGDGPHATAQLGSDTVAFRAYDAVGNLIGSDLYTLGTSRPIEGNVVNLAVNGTGIHSAVVDFLAIEGGTAIDNLRFDVATVPEPTSESVLLGGLLCFALCRRRRK